PDRPRGRSAWENRARRPLRRGREGVRQREPAEKKPPSLRVPKRRSPSPALPSPAREGGLGWENWIASPCASLRARNDKVPPSELHLRRFLRASACREFRHRLVAGENRFRPDDGRKRAQRRIIRAHCLDVIAPRHRDAVLGAFELRL